MWVRRPGHLNRLKGGSSSATQPHPPICTDTIPTQTTLNLLSVVDTQSHTADVSLPPLPFTFQSLHPTAAATPAMDDGWPTPPLRPPWGRLSHSTRASSPPIISSCSGRRMHPHCPPPPPHPPRLCTTTSTPRNTTSTTSTPPTSRDSAQGQMAPCTAATPRRSLTLRPSSQLPLHLPPQLLLPAHHHSPRLSPLLHLSDLTLSTERPQKRLWRRRNGGGQQSRRSSRASGRRHHRPPPTPPPLHPPPPRSPRITKRGGGRRLLVG